MISIIKDSTDGLIELFLVDRIGEKRKHKVGNNYTGITAKADACVLGRLCKLLNKKLPNMEENEVIVGQTESGVAISCALAIERGSYFNYSTLRDYENTGSEKITLGDDRIGRAHKFYGITQGDNIILLEDEVTSGDSILNMYKEFMKQSINIKAIACFVENVDLKAREKIRDKTGFDLISLAKIHVED
jgi:orotate phosphoribosyltransferase